MEICLFRKKLPFIFSIVSISLLLSSCFTMPDKPDEEVWTGASKDPIEVVCGPSCTTIRFAPGSYDLTPRERAKIRRFVYRTGHHQRIFVSPCATNPASFQLNQDRVGRVKDEVRRLRYTPVQLKRTLPENLTTPNCVNLVRGKLSLYVQGCPNKTVEPSVECVGSNFGCTTNHNLAQMIINPWNLLATAGDNGTEGDRVAIGIKNYREGKESKLDMESSS